jgi:hypothetical protein
MEYTFGTNKCYWFMSKHLCLNFLMWTKREQVPSSTIQPYYTWKQIGFYSVSFSFHLPELFVKCRNLKSYHYLIVHF